MFCDKLTAWMRFTGMDTIIEPISDGMQLDLTFGHINNYTGELLYLAQAFSNARISNGYTILSSVCLLSIKFLGLKISSE